MIAHNREQETPTPFVSAIDVEQLARECYRAAHGLGRVEACMFDVRSIIERAIAPLQQELAALRKDKTNQDAELYQRTQS